MELFKGYVRTKDKQCIERFKNRTDFSTLEEIKCFNEYAGILATDTVLIDIDDEKQSDILFNIVKEKQLQCKVIQTTRGKHFYFLNNGNFEKCRTGVKLACGLTADIKIGLKNAYAILKYNRVERPVLYDCDEYQKAPAFLQPVNAHTDFIDMKEGEGRDSALFSYILTLQKAGISKEDCRECIKLINDNLLTDKMSDDDIERITRDDAFNAPVFYNEKGSFLFNEFAKFLISECHIKRINSQLHIYNEGAYISGALELEHAMIKYIPALTKSKRNEVINYLEALIREDTPVSTPKWIAFKNGLLNIQTDEFIEFTPDVVVTNVIPYDYDTDVYDELMDKTLNKLACDDEQVRSLLEEMAGYCLYRRNELGKAFILTGSGSNGKSTFLNVLKKMLGRQNYSVLDMSKLNDRFSTAMMYGKLANIGDDISDGYIPDTAEFKKVVTGESLDAEYKGKDKFVFEPYVKLIFSANSIPRIGKGRDSGAIMRRLVIIPFSAKFSSKDADFVPFIADKLQTDEAIQYLIALGVQGLKRVLLNSSFTSSDRVMKELREFEESNNPLLGFMNEHERADIVGKATKDIYKEYCEYCIDAGLSAVSRIELTKQLKKRFNVDVVERRLNGIKFRVFK